MNNDGDFYIGNKLINSSTGKEETFDIPVPTITGQDPARLSVVFDEVIVKEEYLLRVVNLRQFYLSLMVLLTLIRKSRLMIKQQ